jgi:hypothetical protein
MALIEDLLKSATGLLTTGGSAGDMAGEAANFDNIGKQVQSGVFNVSDPTALNPNATSNRALNPSYNNLGVPENKNLGVAGVNQQQVQTNKPKKSPIAEIAGNPGLFQKIFNMSPQDAQAKWKDKGGFEGLMSNPAFSLGLAMMQSGASGEKISQSIFNNALKAGVVSNEYSERIKNRSTVLAPISAEQRSEVEAVFAEDNYYGPDFIDRIKKGNEPAKFREATDLVFDEADKLAKKEAKGGKQVRLSRKHYRQALENLIKNKKLKKRDPSFWGLRSGTVQATGGISKNKLTPRAEGGPVSTDQNYIVGEKGPEMFVPETNGSILHNDDAKVVSMLLESNPQLKNVSRARAVKILKNRFPDYF